VLGLAAVVRGQSSYAFDVIATFDAVTGMSPTAGVIQGNDGSIYGTTSLGGAFGAGTIFKVDAAGTLTVLHSFTGGAGGANPLGPLTQASDGNFYGTTGLGGALNYGTVFKLDASGTFTTLHTFTLADGAEPTGVIQATDGNFYGTTHNGGAFNFGVAFKLAASGTLTVLHSFSGGLDGRSPSAIIQATDGNFYGTTLFGGTFINGTVFKLDAAGTLTTLHSFEVLDGAEPYAGVIQGANGDFYGTTLYGGAYSSSTGTVFRIDAAGTLTTLYSFTGGEDGAYPYGGVIEAVDGSLYGTTRDGVSFGLGTVFRLDSAGTLSILHTLDGATDGAASGAPLVQADDGSLYGTTSAGGASNGGTLFRLALSVPDPPRRLKADPGDSQISLEWQVSSGAEAYRVKRSTVRTGPYLQIAEVGGTSFTDTSVTNGNRYYYVVTAVNAAGESEPSKSVFKTPRAIPGH
jgi:uncharacterized repeat protein (TIGR03803 family)